MSATDRASTLRSVLMDICQRELLDEESLSRVEDYLARERAGGSEPWFIKALIAIGAWVAAVCFIACLGIAELIDDSWLKLIGWGVAFLVAATFLRRFTEHIFPVQLALAWSCVGHGLVIAGVAELFWGDSETIAVAATAMILCVVLYPIYPDSLHRFLSCALASSCLIAWIIDSGVWPLLPVEMLSKVIIIGMVFMYRRDLIILHPLGYAMAISVPASLLLVLAPKNVLDAPWWPTNIALAASLIWLYQWVAGGWSKLRTEPLALAVAATVCLACFTTPGTLAALGLMILGYASNDRYLLATGVLFFPVFIIVFYYEWDLSLLVKSWIMLGSGAVLLTARWLLRLRGWTDGLT